MLNKYDTSLYITHIVYSCIFNFSSKKWYSCFRKSGWRKKTSPRWPQFFYQFNWIFKIKFTLKYLLWQHFSWLKNKEPYLLFQEKKRKFVRINLLVEYFLCCVFFWNKKHIFLYTHDLCGRVGHPADFRKQDYFFGLSSHFLFFDIIFCVEKILLLKIFCHSKRTC